MSQHHDKRAVGTYLNKRAELGQMYRNDRLSSEKRWADAELRGKLGCQRANEVIAAVDKLRSRGL